MGAIREFLLLTEELREAIVELGGGLLEYTFEIYDNFGREVIEEVVTVVDRNRGTRLRKISVLPDREGKTRLFAILDY